MTMSEEPWPPDNDERGTWQDTLGDPVEQEILIIPLNPLIEVTVASVVIDWPCGIVSDPAARLSEKSESFNGVRSNTAADTLGPSATSLAKTRTTGRKVNHCTIAARGAASSVGPRFEPWRTGHHIRAHNIHDATTLTADAAG
jgi:hypothetical protein